MYWSRVGYSLIGTHESKTVFLFAENEKATAKVPMTVSNRRRRIRSWDVLAVCWWRPIRCDVAEVLLGRSPVLLPCLQTLITVDRGRIRPCKGTLVLHVEYLGRRASFCANEGIARFAIPRYQNDNLADSAA